MGFFSKLKDESGIAAVIVAVSLTGLLGAGVLAIDAGSNWATRRRIVTATDAGALGAARLFATGLADPCTLAGQNAGEAEASAIMAGNAEGAEHNATSTPDGYKVDVSDCAGPVGHVRFDGRLAAQQNFSGIFGFGQTKPISSSTAEFGWVTAISGGLRPWTICDQHDPWPLANAAPNPLPSSSGAGPFAHYALWNWLQKGQITQAQYDSYFGSNATEYPTFATNGKNAGASKLYLSPANGGGVVHRINLKDNCGGGASWRGWTDYSGKGSNTNTLRDWIRSGYPGTVNLTPHDCESGESTGDCDASTGNHNGLEPALDDITCDYNTPSKDCFTFPVILNEGVEGNGGSLHIDHSAFIFVILRGFGDNGQNNPCSGNSGCLLDMEFVSVQATGKIGANPSGDATTPRGTALCDVDHGPSTSNCA